MNAPGFDPKNVTGIPSTAPLREEALEQAEMSMLLQIIHSWLLQPAPGHGKISCQDLWQSNHLT